MSVISDKSLTLKPTQPKESENENGSCEMKRAKGSIPPHRRVIFHMQPLPKQQPIEIEGEEE